MVEALVTESCNLDARAYIRSFAACVIDCRNNEQGEIVGGRCAVCRVFSSRADTGSRKENP
jgi:hypothetical protein